MEFNIDTIINHIKTLQRVQETKIRTEVSSIDDGLLSNCFNADNEQRKGLKIHPIHIDIESMQKEFVENHNKMILLSIMYCINEDFRKLQFKSQLAKIEEMITINIHNCIGTRNDKNIRFYKLDKKSINHYADSNDYSNGMIDLYANIFNINIFIVEYKDGRYPIGFFSLNEKFNINKPSIIIWHPNKFMYYPISINYEFKFYKNNKLFDEFLKNKFITVNPILIDNKTFIKDINVSNEKLLTFGYDDDLQIIYKYKITPSRKSKKVNKIENNNDKIENNDDKDEISQEEIECTQEELKDAVLILPKVKEDIKEKTNIDCSTEQAIENVIVPSYDKDELVKMTKNEIEVLMKKNNLKTTIKGSTGKYIKKTKDQMIEDLINKNLF